MPKIWFDELTMEEAKKAAKEKIVIILPIGSVEEHGTHLPLCTDSIQPEYVAVEVAKKTDCLIAPPLRYGVCNSTRNFPGTITIKFETLHNIARDIIEEFFRNGFRRFMILSGHAGNSHMAALRLAVQKTIWEHEKASDNFRLRIMVLSDYDFAYELKGKYADEQDGHGGTIETSRVLAIRPELVTGRSKKSIPRMPRFEITVNPEACFPSGIIGDPVAASSEKGRLINRYIVDEVIKRVKELEKD